MIILWKYFEILGWQEQQKDKEKVLASTVSQYLMYFKNNKSLKTIQYFKNNTSHKTKT